MRNERLPADQRKRQIRYCAKDVFIRKGFHNTTMEDVIAESGLSKGGVYRHYKSTTEMMYDLMEDGCYYRYNVVDNFLKEHKDLDKYDALSEIIVEKILADNELLAVYVMFLQEKNYDESLENLYFKLERETLINMRSLLKNMGINFDFIDDRFFSDFINSLILGGEILKAKGNFYKNKENLKDMLKIYFKNSDR